MLNCLFAAATSRDVFFPAGQKLADRLAAAAREKLARESKERQLQAQRKRKAAMFINMLKDIDGTAAPNAGTTGAGAAGTAAPAEDGGTGERAMGWRDFVDWGGGGGVNGTLCLKIVYSVITLEKF